MHISDYKRALLKLVQKPPSSPKALLNRPAIKTPMITKSQVYSLQTNMIQSRRGVIDVCSDAIDRKTRLHSTFVPEPFSGDEYHPESRLSRHRRWNASSRPRDQS